MTAIASFHPDFSIQTERILNASIDMVFSAWADPLHLSNWWGPAGFTNTFEQFDFRPGGKWKFVMHGPGKGNYKNEVEFLRIEKPTLIHWKRISKPLFEVLVTFESLSPTETKVIFRQIFETVEECKKLKPFVVEKNEENFDKLEEELLNMDQQHAITRAGEADYDEITEIWERSVRATHHFLKEEDIQYYKPLVRDQYLGMVDLYCIRDAEGIQGFLGLSEDKIEMLFIDPDFRGQGIGGRLLRFAIKNLGIRKVDVNEQNEQALDFYKHYGFEVIGRTEHDATGRNYPILNMMFKWSAH